METVFENSLRLWKDPPSLQKCQNVLSLEMTSHSEWHSKIDITVSVLSQWNVFLYPKRVKSLDPENWNGLGFWQVVTNGKSPPRSRIFVLCSADYHVHIHATSSAYIHSFPTSSVLSTGSLDKESKGLARDHPACISKASFAIVTARAEFLFVSLIFRVGFCCSRLPWGSISTVYVAPSASSHICLMSERYH